MENDQTQLTSPLLRPFLFLLAVIFCSLLLFVPDILRPFSTPHSLSRQNWPQPDWQLSVTPSCSRIQLLVMLLDADPGQLDVPLSNGTAQCFRLRNTRPLTQLARLGDILTGSWPEIHGLVTRSSLDALPPFDLLSTLRKRGISSEWIAPRVLGIPPAARWSQSLDRPAKPSEIPWNPTVNPGFRMAVLPSRSLPSVQLIQRIANGLTTQADPREIRMVLAMHDGPWISLYLNHAGTVGTGDRHDLATTIALLLGAPPPPAGLGTMLSLAIPDEIKRQHELSLAAVQHQQKGLFPGIGPAEKITEHLSRLAIRGQLSTRFVSLLCSMILFGLAIIPLRRLPGGGQALAALPLLLAGCGLLIWLIPGPASLETLLQEQIWQKESLIGFMISFISSLCTLMVMTMLERKYPASQSGSFRLRADRDSIFLTAAFLITLPYFIGLVWTSASSQALLPGAGSLTFLLRLRFVLIGQLFALAAQTGASLLRKETTAA